HQKDVPPDLPRHPALSNRLRAQGHRGDAVLSPERTDQRPLRRQALQPVGRPAGREARDQRRDLRVAIMYVRKHIRAKAVDNKAFSRSLRIASQAWFGTQYEETRDGYRVRIWGDPNEDWVKKEDVRAWLTGVRVIDDLREGLEFVRESYIKTMISND